MKETIEKFIKTMAISWILAMILLVNMSIVEANTRNDIVNIAKHAINQSADSSTKIKSGTVGNWNFLASIPGRYKVLAERYTVKDYKTGVTTSCFASLWSTSDDGSGCDAVINSKPSGYNNNPISFYDDVDHYGLYAFTGNNPDGQYPSGSKKDPVKEPIAFPTNAVGRFGQCKFAADLIISEAKKEIVDKNHITMSDAWNVMARTIDDSRNTQKTIPGDVIFAYVQTGDYDKDKNPIYGYVYLTVLKVTSTDPKTGSVIEIEARNIKANKKTLKVGDSDETQNLSKYSIAKYMRGIEYAKPADYIFMDHYVYGETPHAAIVAQINSGDFGKGTVSSLDVVDSNYCGNYPGDYGTNCEVGKYHTIEWSKGSFPLSKYFVYTGTSYYDEPWDPSGVSSPLPKPKPKDVSITVTSPNGGEKWIIGTPYIVQWNFTGNPGKFVKIELLNSEVGKEPVTLLGNFIPIDYPGYDGGKGLINEGWAFVNINFQPPGKEYKVRVTSITDPKYTDISDTNFAISLPPKPTTITVSPSTATVEVGSGQKFTATSLDQDGKPIEAVIAWNVENPAVGSIDAAGNFIGASVGTTKVIASNGTVSGNATIEVTNPVFIGGLVHNVNKNTDYTSIQKAIDDSAIGDEIDVYSGTYPESLNIAMEQIHIKGIDTGAGKPIIDNGVTGDTVTLSADQITFEGFVIRRPMMTPYSGISVTSDYNIIANNDVSFNYFGISLRYSSNNNTLIGNNISNNDYGIYLYSSNNNILIENNISKNNVYGIFVYMCNFNKIYHNNFVNNSMQATFEYDLANAWDSGYPGGGNYWKDYTGTDSLNGVNQNLPGSDGIGDISYSIKGHIGGGTIGYVQDRYPLMDPYS